MSERVVSHDANGHLREDHDGVKTDKLMSKLEERKLGGA